MALTIWKPLECVQMKEDAISYMEAVIEDIRHNGTRSIDISFFFLSLKELTDLAKKRRWIK